MFVGSDGPGFIVGLILALINDIVL